MRKVIVQEVKMVQKKKGILKSGICGKKNAEEGKLGKKKKKKGRIQLSGQ